MGDGINNAPSVHAADVATGLWLPYSPLAHSKEFTPLPASYFAFICAPALFYLALVEWAKLRVLKKCGHA